MLPSMADVLGVDSDNQLVDIISLKADLPLTKDQSDDIKMEITTELFTKEDISNIKFEPPYFDGNKLRIICNNADSEK